MEEEVEQEVEEEMEEEEEEGIRRRKSLKGDNKTSGTTPA